MTRHAKIALASVALALSLAVTGVSAWAAGEYAAGRDPFLPIDAALVTTVESTEDIVSDNSSYAPAQADPAAEAKTDALPDEHDDVGQPSVSADDSASVDADEHAGSAHDASGSVDVSTPDDDLMSQSDDSAELQEASAVSISVTIDASAAGADIVSSVVALPSGGTALDALVATGVGVNARATSFGTYVGAINGLAEKEHGAMSGWVYAVDGVEPNTAASNYVLADGSNVVWTYVNVEY